MGVLVFAILAVIGVVLAIVLSWYFKCGHIRHFMKMESEGIENPNYGDVDRGPLISQIQTTAVPRDYEVPVLINNSEPVQQQQQQQPQAHHGRPTQRQYVNIPDRTLTSPLTGSCNSGDYSYVFVRPPQHQAVCPQRSHDSHFLQSTESGSNLPILNAAESGDPTSGTDYTLLKD